MRLLCITVSGFRRFAESNSVRLFESVIALVGPNEAGKSSFLTALAQLATDEPINIRDRTRRTELETKISGLFELDDDDKDAIKGLGITLTTNKCVLSKSSSGKFSAHLVEQTVPHDLEKRKKTLEMLLSLLGNKAISRYGSQAQQEERKTKLNTVISAIKTSDIYLGEARLETLRKFMPILDEWSRIEAFSESDRAILSAMAERIRNFLQHEEACAPEQLRQLLVSRRPGILIFDEESRDLKSSYDLATLAHDPPPALANLANLAKLNLPSLLAAQKSKDRALVQEIIDAANTELKRKFSTAWVRADVFPKISPDGTTITLLISTPDMVGLSAIDERSDGLRWFLAFIAFLSGKKGVTKPILLVDEAERHLSYDAQASLVAVLERQNLAQKIIYTTHSAGCLPSDLGTRIRPVIPQEGERSKIENAFWVSGRGFRPLTFAMGMSSLAFTPARNVLIGEGPSECILLPTLIRQANRLDRLNFQVAPGASGASAKDVTTLLSEGGNVAFILDGDDGGNNIKNLLTEAGAPPTVVRTYRDFSNAPIVLEDLVKLEIYIDAYNDELRRWQSAGVELTKKVFAKTGRAKSAEACCKENQLKPVDKPILCQRLVDIAYTKKIIEPSHEQVLIDLYNWASEHFSAE